MVLIAAKQTSTLRARRSVLEHSGWTNDQAFFIAERAAQNAFNGNTLVS